MAHNRLFVVAFLSFLSLIASGYASPSTDYLYEPVRITIKNSGRETIWPEIATNPSSPLQPVTTQGFALEPGKSKNATVLPNWEGRIWAKTQCTPDAAAGVLCCATGDCGSFLAADCPPPTATVAEFRLNKTGSGQFYSFSVNLERGFNLPLMVVAHGGTRTKCGAAHNLQVMDGDNNYVVGCKNSFEVGDYYTEIFCLSAAFYTVEFGPLSLPPAPCGETNGDHDSQEGYDFSEKPNRKKKSKPNIIVIIGIIITVMSLLVGLISWKFKKIYFCNNSFNLFIVTVRG